MAPSLLDRRGGFWFFNDVKRHLQAQGRTHIGITLRDTATSFTARFYCTCWQPRLRARLRCTARVLRMITTDWIRAGGKDYHKGESAQTSPGLFPTS